MKLSRLNIGEKAHISLSAFQSPIVCRLVDMGLSEKSSVQCLFQGLFGSIRAYRIGKSVIAIRKEDARNIEVFK